MESKCRLEVSFKSKIDFKSRSEISLRSPTGVQLALGGQFEGPSGVQEALGAAESASKSKAAVSPFSACGRFVRADGTVEIMIYLRNLRSNVVPETDYIDAFTDLYEYVCEIVA